MKLGAHVSTSGGLSKAIDRAQDMGAETAQLFASSPRSWAFKPPTAEEVAVYRNKAEARDISPVFLHGSYLVNIGGAAELVEKSVDSLVEQMGVAGQIGAAGLIFHGGSHKGAGFDAILDQATKAMTEVLSNTPQEVWLIIENSAGMGAHVGASFAEIGRMIKAVDNPRVMVCLDTQHALAAGYNVVDPRGLETAMEEFDSQIGLSRLAVVHANDSKMEIGSGVDRHENIGEGHVGTAGFETIMNHPSFRDIPFILEVPGFDKKGPDKRNLDRLKDIRRRLSISR